MASLLPALLAIFVISLDDASALNLTGLDTDRYWGLPELVNSTDTTISNYTIQFDSDMITDLRTRLTNRRTLKGPLAGQGFKYGFNSSCVAEWADYWAADYDFEERAAFFNTYPWYNTTIQGLDIKFIWIKPNITDSNVTVVPLLMLHGWPGSIREFYEAIPLITKYPNDHGFAVELVVPSLPGFGFSDPTFLPGLGAAEIGVVMRNLMRRLGYEQFYIQGGDFGSVTGSYMSTVFPTEVLGFHSNFAYTLGGLIVSIFGAAVPTTVTESDYVSRMYPLGDVMSFLVEETGYMHEQATKPDTIGIALADSPIGLLTYLLEKFSSGYDRNNRELPDGGLSTFNKTHILDHIMMYWAPNSLTTQPAQDVCIRPI